MTFIHLHLSWYIEVYMLIGDYFFQSSGRGYQSVATNQAALNAYANAGNIQYSIGSSPDIWFYQGTIPTTAVMDAFAQNTRISDCLLQFTGTTISYANGNQVIFAGGTTFGTIVATGTIGWFCIGPQSLSGSNKILLFGTVGLTGSGSDLILPKTTVATGDLWLLNLTLAGNNSLTQVS
jgi:hypothetical protein